MMIKLVVATMVCLLGLKIVAAMPVADHHEGHVPLPVAPLEEKVPVENLKAAEVTSTVVQDSQHEEPALSQPQAAAEQAAAVDTLTLRSSEPSSGEAQQSAEVKEEPQPEQAKAVEEALQPKSSEEHLEEKEEPKVLAAEPEKKVEESLKEAASESQESVQSVPQEQPVEVPIEKKVVGFLSF